MNPFDTFFKKYSYKFPKGYPDMNNEQDILLLENILEDLVGEAFSVFPTTEDEISNEKIKELDKEIILLNKMIEEYNVKLKAYN